jgi:hypothetical protein
MFFFPELRYCSEECLQAATEDRRRNNQREEFRGERYQKTRHWALYDGAGELICLTVYRRGAEEVRRRLTRSTTFTTK